MSNSIADIKDTDVIFMIGSNADSGHPTIGLRLHQAIDQGTRLIVVDPRGTDFAKRAEHWVRLNPGTDVALLNGMMREIIKTGWHDLAFIENRTENFEELEIVTEKYSPEYVEGITGISPQQLHDIATLYASPGKK